MLRDPAPGSMSRVVHAMIFAVLVLVIAVAAPPSNPKSGAAPAWELGEYQETRLETRGGKAELRGPTATVLKLESTAVIRPRLAPGERAALVAQYSVAALTATEVKETRIVRFSETVLLSRETVVTRSAGQWRSEFVLPIPVGAAEGLYTLTTRIEPMARSARGVAEEKSSVFAVSAAASPPPAAAAPRPPAAAAQRPTAEAANGLHISLWTDKQRYRVGETATFYFETSRDGYVALINAGTSGAVTILFPNRFSQGHEVKGKTTYSIPRPEDGYTMNVGGPPGIELVYALVTLEPIKFADADFSRTRSIFRSVEGGAISRDINAVAKQTRIDKQAKAMIELEVVK